VDGAQALDADALDVDDHLRRTYEPAVGEQVLIRRDGHLRWRGSGAVPTIGTTSFLGAPRLLGRHEHAERVAADRTTPPGHWRNLGVAHAGDLPS